MRRPFAVSVFSGLFVGALGLASLTVFARDGGQTTPSVKATATPATPAEAPAAPAAPAAEPFDATDCKACHEPAVSKLNQTHHGRLEQSCATCHDRAKSIAHSKGRAEGNEVPGPSVKAMKPRDVN